MKLNTIINAMGFWEHIGIESGAKHSIFCAPYIGLPYQYTGLWIKGEL